MKENMSPVDKPLSTQLMLAFQISAERHFAKVALGVDSRLERLSPSLFGFLTKSAVVTIGVYPGHLPSVCVKLRRRQPEDTLDVNDKRDIGLANVVAFSRPAEQSGARQEHGWTEGSLDAELARLAANLSQHGRPFLSDLNADWDGLRLCVDKRTKKKLAEMPWLKKY